MPAHFVNLDRQTPMFLACDLRDWIPADHLVHFILDAVGQIRTAHFQVNHRGTGTEIPEGSGCGRVGGWNLFFGATPLFRNDPESTRRSGSGDTSPVRSQTGFG